jgi:hypothetical protein
MPIAKTTPSYEVQYVTITVSVSIVEGLHPYLIDEAARRGVSVDTVASGVLNENLARKRIQSRSHANKKAKLTAKTVSPLNRNK